MDQFIEPDEYYQGEPHPSYDDDDDEKNFGFVHFQATVYDPPTPHDNDDLPSLQPFLIRQTFLGDDHDYYWNNLNRIDKRRTWINRYFTGPKLIFGSPTSIEIRYQAFRIRNAFLTIQRMYRIRKRARIVSALQIFPYDIAIHVLNGYF